jgi:predicted alpha/beta-fold hydrolase
MAHMHSFRPFPFLQNPHLQTVLSTYSGKESPPPSFTQFITLSDGDVLAAEVSRPKDWKEENQTLVLVHGLAGSSGSSYLIRLTHKFLAENKQIVRLNLRGSGKGEGLAHKPYHGGLSGDLYEVIKVLNQNHPKSPLILVGFSLGGNMVLKLAGEFQNLETHLKKVIAICPPISLEDSARRFQKSSNFFYQRSFLKYLRNIVRSKKQKFSQSLNHALLKCSSLYEFDDLFTAPFWGFKNAKDYYNRCSSKAFISKITLPCHILFAEDDPLVNSDSINETTLPSNIDLLITPNGGHMGFLGHPKYGSIRWMDEQILKWSNL